MAKKMAYPAPPELKAKPTVTVTGKPDKILPKSHNPDNKLPARVRHRNGYRGKGMA